MEIKALTYNDIDELISFSASNAEEFKYFSPHDFTREVLSSIIDNAKKDLYFIITHNNKVIGYGILRGMDEGYVIPSLGIGIDKNFTGKGVAIMFMKFLETAAKLDGYTKIRLRVFKENYKAALLYKKLGYNMSDYDDETLIGIKDL